MQPSRFLRRRVSPFPDPSRSYRPAIDDPELEVRLLRAQEISRYVEHGYLDVGITGRDWVAENDSDVEEVVVLPYSKTTSAPTRWVLVVPEASPIKTVKDLEGSAWPRKPWA